MSTPLPPGIFESVGALEKALGAPSREDLPFSFAAASENEERGSFPQAACVALHAWGLTEHFIPAALGGRWRSMAELTQLLRAVARRDIAIAISHGISFLGALPVFISGSGSLQQSVVTSLRKGRRIGFVLTERGHGADLLSTETAALAEAGGERWLSGEKWLVNGGTAAELLSVFARTRPEGGGRGFSFILVDKAAAPPGTFQPLPKIRTVGVRAADISGIRFERLPVSAEAIVGAEGAGLEVVVKALQVTRIFAAALSLGAADTATRLVCDFALSRKLYGAPIIEIPHVRSVLAAAAADHIASECLLLMGAQLVHGHPEQLALPSASVKYLVPTLCSELIRSLAVVLGARHYLREELHHGAFARLLRDSELVPLFDGSTVVNLTTIALNMRQALAHSLAPDAPSVADELAQLADLRSAPPLALERLSLSPRGRDALLRGLLEAPAALRIAQGGPPIAPEVEADLQRLTKRLAREVSRLRAQVARVPGWSDATQQRPAEVYELARRFSALHAAAASIWIWSCNRSRSGAFFARGEWLALALERLLAVARGNGAPRRAPHERAVLEGIIAMHAGGEAVSLSPAAWWPHG